VSDLLDKIATARCRSSYSAFLSRIDIPGAPSLYGREEDRFTGAPRILPKHQEEVAKVLELAAYGEIERFMLFLPPGTAKSTLASVCLPPFAMGLGQHSARKPAWAPHSEFAQVILASYGTTLARKMSRRARGIARSAGYRKIFGNGVSRESSAAGEWATEAGATMLGCGIDAGITGNRATLGIVDDPFKGRKQAESPTIRKRVREEIEDSMQTRIVPGGSLGFMFTRFVMDDPATWYLGEDYDGSSGWIKGTDGLRYFVLNIPAECEREDDPLGRKIGEYIWPERFSPEFWAPHKRIERKWSSLFQQRPAPKAGLIFKRHWFKLVRPDEVPKYATRGRGWDWAASVEDENPGANATSGTKLARAGEKLFIEHNVNAKLSAGDIDKLFVNQVRIDGPGCIVAIPQDPGQAGKDQASRRAKAARNAGAVDVRVSAEYGGKIYRADTAASEAEKGNVHIVMGDWNYQRFIDQLCDFPTGKEDDDVDSLSRICNELVQSATMGKVATRF